MSEEQPARQDRENHLVQDISRKAERKLRARQTRHDSMWYGMGMMGMVGWSVAIPTVLGVAIGLWLEKQVEVSFSWTLTMLITGVVVGCLNAWYWISKEGRHITSRNNEKPEKSNDV